MPKTVTYVCEECDPLARLHHPVMLFAPTTGLHTGRGVHGVSPFFLVFIPDELRAIPNSSQGRAQGIFLVLSKFGVWIMEIAIAGVGHLSGIITDWGGVGNAGGEEGK